MKKIKSLLNRFWFWLRSKTTLDEKAIDVYEEAKSRANDQLWMCNEIKTIDYVETKNQ